MARLVAFKKFTVRLDRKSYEAMEKDRGELTQSQYIIHLIKKFQLKQSLRKRKNSAMTQSET